MAYMQWPLGVLSWSIVAEYQASLLRVRLKRIQRWSVITSERESSEGFERTIHLIEIKGF